MLTSYVQPLSRAWKRMIAILFRPFDLSKWIVIAFSAWVAGVLDGIGGGRVGRPHFRVGPDAVDPRVAIETLRQGFARLHSEVDRIFGMWPLAEVLAIVVPVALGVALLLTWLSSRFKFVYLDNLVKNRAEIVEPWRRLGALGDSLFVWRLVFGVAAAVVAVVLVLLFGGVGILTGHAHWPSAIPVLVFGVLLALLFALALLYTWLFLESFVIPVMYRFNLTATAAWQHFLRWLAADSPRFVLYGLFILALLVPIAIGIVIVGFATCCVGFLLMALPYVGVLVLLPLHVTYRLLGPEFLAQFDSSFDLFGSQRG